MNDPFIRNTKKRINANLCKYTQKSHNTTKYHGPTTDPVLRDVNKT